MKVNRTFAAIVSAAVISLGAAACTTSTSAGTNVEQNTEGAQATQYSQAQPIPFFKWSLERQVLIDAETASAEGDQSTSFFFNFGIQDPIMTCPSLGMAVPDTSQLSNPEQVVSNRQNKRLPSGDWTNMPQADPFGVFTPATSDGTYVICIIGGKPVLQRAEETVHTVMAPAVWNAKTHQIQITGNPTTNVVTHK